MGSNIYYTLNCEIGKEVCVTGLYVQGCTGCQVAKCVALAADCCTCPCPGITCALVPNGFGPSQCTHNADGTDTLACMVH